MIFPQGKFSCGELTGYSIHYSYSLYILAHFLVTCLPSVVVWQWHYYNNKVQSNCLLTNNYQIQLKQRINNKKTIHVDWRVALLTSQQVPALRYNSTCIFPESLRVMFLVVYRNNFLPPLCYYILSLFYLFFHQIFSSSVNCCFLYT